MPADYVPYGPEWETEMMRMRKVDLVDMVRRAMAKVENGSSHNRPSTKLFTREQVVDALDGCSNLQSALSLFRQWGK